MRAIRGIHHRRHWSERREPDVLEAKHLAYAIHAIVEERYFAALTYAQMAVMEPESCGPQRLLPAAPGPVQLAGAAGRAACREIETGAERLINQEGCLMPATKKVSNNETGSKKSGLYANIQAKRERIEHGSGEHMRKAGEEGAPSSEAFEKSAKTSTVAKKAARKTAVKKSPARKPVAKKTAAGKRSSS